MAGIFGQDYQTTINRSMRVGNGVQGKTFNPNSVPAVFSYVPRAGAQAAYDQASEWLQAYYAGASGHSADDFMHYNNQLVASSQLLANPLAPLPVQSYQSPTGVGVVAPPIASQGAASATLPGPDYWGDIQSVILGIAMDASGLGETAIGLQVTALTNLGLAASSLFSGNVAALLEIPVGGAGGTGVSDVSDAQLASLSVSVNEILQIISGAIPGPLGQRMGLLSVTEWQLNAGATPLGLGPGTWQDSFNLAYLAGNQTHVSLIRSQSAPCFLIGVNGDGNTGDVDSWPDFHGLDPSLQQLGQSDVDFLASQYPLRAWVSNLDGTPFAGCHIITESGYTWSCYYAPVGVSTRPQELTWAYEPSSGLPLRSGQTDYMLVLSMLPIQFPTTP